VRVQRLRIEAARAHAIERGGHAVDIGVRLALVRVDHVEAAPVPQEHVDLPRPVLVEAGDHEPAAHAAQLRCEIERTLRADQLEHAVAAVAAGELLDARDDRSIIGAELDGLGRAHPLRDVERGRALRDRDHAGTGPGRELHEQRTEEADADHGDRLARLDPAAAPDVHRAAERLGRHVGAAQVRRQHHHRRRRRHVVLGERMLRQEPDALARGDLGDLGTDRDHRAPALVAGRAGRPRVREPRAPLPQRQVRAAYAAALDADQHVLGAGGGRVDLAQLERLRCGDDGGAHARGNGLTHGRLPRRWPPRPRRSRRARRGAPRRPRAAR
jgi:hypothetical protein